MDPKVVVLDEGSGSAARAAALAIAVRLGQLRDAHAPDVGSVLEVIPSELSGLLRLHPVVQGPRVVVVEDFHRLGRAKAAEGGEDQGMALELSLIHILTLPTTERV